MGDLLALLELELGGLGDVRVGIVYFANNFRCFVYTRSNQPCLYETQATSLNVYFKMSNNTPKRISYSLVSQYLIPIQINSLLRSAHSSETSIPSRSKAPATATLCSNPTNSSASPCKRTAVGKPPFNPKPTRKSTRSYTETAPAPSPATLPANPGFLANTYAYRAT